MLEGHNSLCPHGNSRGGKAKTDPNVCGVTPLVGFFEFESSIHWGVENQAFLCRVPGGDPGVFKVAAQVVNRRRECPLVETRYGLWRVPGRAAVIGCQDFRNCDLFDHPKP
jgi:hypothetical protein